MVVVVGRGQYKPFHKIDIGNTFQVVNRRTVQVRLPMYITRVPEDIPETKCAILHLLATASRLQDDETIDALGRSCSKMMFVVLVLPPGDLHLDRGTLGVSFAAVVPTRGSHVGTRCLAR
jgi:hypothetical protein